MSADAVLLGEVSTINPRMPNNLAADEKVGFVPMAAVHSDRLEVIPDEARAVRELKNGFTYFSRDDVLVAKITPCFENCKIALAKLQHEHGFGSTEFHVVRSAKDKLDPRYLVHYLRQKRVLLDGERKMTGSAGQRRVPKHFLASLKIPLPPLDEQRRIAAILDAADSLRAKRRAALAKLDQLAQSIFIEMFGDWSRPGSNMPTKCLGDCLDFLTSGSRGWARHYSDRGSLFLRIQNVRRDELSLSEVAFVDAPETAEAKRTRVKPGDVLLSITADLGRTAVIPDDIGPAYINQHLCILRTSELEPRFLSAALASPGGQKAIRSKNREGVKAGLNFDDVRSLEIPNVGRGEQARFALLADKADHMRRVNAKSLSDLTALFASLQHRAFRGEL